MNNKEYLDQIAVKSRVKTGIKITPFMIKVTGGILLVIISLCIVLGIVNGSNAKITQTYERAYLRISNLSTSNPFQQYSTRLRNSDLLFYYNTFMTSITATNSNLAGALSSVNVKPEKISKEVTEAEATNLAIIDTEISNALYDGDIDRTFASNLYYQISTILQYETDAIAKSKSASFNSILSQSMEDLTILHDQVKKWIDTH